MSSLTKNPTSSPSPGPAPPRRPPSPLAFRTLHRRHRPPPRLPRPLSRPPRQSPRPLGPIVRFFSSVWLGLTWLFLTAIYIGIGSGFAGLRARMEMTDMQFFDAWPMVTLMLLLGTTLSVVTLRRIPLTLYRLGVWTVHLGILTLLTGCFIYFSGKQEGQVRIYQNQSASAYFDSIQRALYLHRDTAPETMLPLPGLPIYYERLTRDAYPEGQNNPLNMPVTTDALAQTDPLLKDISLRVIGYYPYADMKGPWVAGPSDAPPTNPALRVAREDAADTPMTLRQREVSEWLIAGSPADRVLDSTDAPFGIEYLDQPTAAKLEDIHAAFEGPMGLTVRIPKLNINRVYTAQKGKPIVIEGSPYTLTPADLTPEMPMRSKGYEGASSSGLAVDVVRKDAGGQDFKFQRWAVSRYPERSPDFITDADGKPKRVQDRVDNDIEIIFHDAAHDQFWFVRDGKGAWALVHRTPDGKNSSVPLLEPGKTVPVTMGANKFALGIGDWTPAATQAPRVIPPRFRERGTNVTDAITASVVELEISRGNWSQRRIYVPFSPFAQTDTPVTVNVPELGNISLIYSTLRRPLPADVELTNFQVIKRPGARQAIEDWISTVSFKTASGASAAPISLNHPAKNQGLVYFQSGWSGREDLPPEQQYTILGVGNRPGTGIMITGAIMMAIGVLYAFYVKPVLLSMKKKELAAAMA